MKRFLSLWVWVFACTIAFSQNDQRIAKSKTSLTDIQQVVMPLQDNAALLEEEMQRRGPGVPSRFAVNLETDISPNTHGQWERLANGQALWRLRILSKNAKSLNLGFTKYNMPRDGSLIIYSPDQERVMGPFTPSDNEEHEQLWTPILEGDELVIEVKVPLASKDQLELELKYVNHDFEGFSQIASGSCNLDVVCGGADGWDIVDKYRDIIQSVAVYSLNGGQQCTGFLINNTRQDCTPYFMTANHCGVNNNNAPSLVAFWNFENSTCRQPNSPESGGNGDGTLNDFNSGSTFRAAWSPSDFTLVELDDPISETANGFFAGWSAEFIMPQDTIIAIHHPNLDEKRISFEFDPAQPGNGLNSNIVDISNATHVIVPDWDIGTTEPGSSGSPLFNSKRQVVGQLHGGGAACGNDDYDTYGWFQSSWEGGGTPTTRLKDWLDPDDLGMTEIDGRYAVLCNFFVAVTPTSQGLCAPADATFSIEVSENFQNDVDLTINNLPNGLSATIEDNPVAPGATTTLTISNTGAIAGGSYTFELAGADGMNANSSTITLNIVDGIPSPPTLNIPADQESGVVTIPIFNWDTQNNSTYTIEVATDPDFNNIIESMNGINDNEIQISSALATMQLYYWRVKGNNICGDGDWSATYSFTTADILCSAIASTDIPVTIPQNGSPVVSSTINIQTTGKIDDVNVNNIDISHTWISDIRIELTSPEGTTIELMNNVFGGDCEEDNAAISFDDQSINPYAMLDGMCNASNPALEGTFQPSAPLTTFADEEAMGVWTLTIFDDANFDGGSLNDWELEICTTIPNDNSVTPSEDEIMTCMGVAYNFTISLGTGFESTNIDLSTDNLPMGAMATFDPNPAMPGDQVNVTLSAATEVGIFNVDIIADDGVDIGQSQIQWTVDGPAAPTNLISPTDGELDVSIEPTLTWEAVPEAINYKFEIATDSDFNNIISESTQTQTSISLPPILNGLTLHYWRITSFNNCGGTTIAPFNFTTEDANAVVEIDGLQLEILPNPTNGILQINSSTPLNKNIKVKVFSVNGIRLLDVEMEKGFSQTIVDLTDYPSGIYLLQLATESTLRTERIVVE